MSLRVKLYDNGDGGMFLALTDPKPKVRRHRHKWACDGIRGTYCYTCGKPHPTEGRK